MKTENNMLTFSDVEPIIEAKKVPTQYRYYVSIIAMTSMLVRLDYDPDGLYIQNGWWEIPSPPQYADNVSYTQPPIRISGIGFFEDFSNKLPSIVMNTEKQGVYILDKRHIDELNNKTNKSSITLTISFDRLFEDHITWTSLMDEVTKSKES